MSLFCSGTVYAVIYEVDNTKNRSEPLRGITHPQLLYQNGLVCLVVIKVLCSLFYSQARLPAAVRENEPANPGDGGNRAYSTRVKSYYIFRGGGGEANYSNLEWLLQARLISHFYKISNIVRAPPAPSPQIRPCNLLHNSYTESSGLCNTQVII